MQTCRCVVLSKFRDRLRIFLDMMLTILQMVTVEVNLREDDEQPEQHLDEGEHIERVIVPLNELYDKLQGK